MDSRVLKDMPIREQVGEAEWKTRVDLAACYRLMALYGMTDLVFNHITARVPDRHDEILINAFGYLYEEITASSLYKIDIEGNVLLKPQNEYGVNQAGYVIHSAIHGAVAEAACVIHTHSRASMAVSAMECGLLPLTQTAMLFHGGVSYHEFEGIAFDVAERARLVADLGRNQVMLLRNHGLLVVGRSVGEAFTLNYMFEMACKAQVDAMASSAKLHYPSEAVMRKTGNFIADSSSRPDYGELVWPALLRQLDRRDPSYAT